MDGVGDGGGEEGGGATDGIWLPLEDLLGDGLPAGGVRGDGGARGVDGGPGDGREQELRTESSL